MNENLVQSFEEQVKKTPARIAVTDLYRSITYDILNQEVNQLARYFRTKYQLKQKEYVGIILDHTCNMIIAILAVLKCGCTYVPMEPDFPQKRIETILNEVNVKLVITEQKYSHFSNKKHCVFEFSEQYKSEIAFMNSEDLNLKIDQDTNAYVLYTSGSTGKPKGVMVCHRNVINYANAFHHEFSLSESDCMLQNSVCTFDIFVEETFPILLCGGTLAVISQKANKNISSLIDFINSKKVTIISTFPYLYIEFNKMEQLPKSLRVLISGGDILRKEYIDKLINKIDIYNTYGPTETTVCASYYKCSKENFDNYDYIPIGKPILNTDIYLLNNNLDKVQNGEDGEICITGEGVSMGYFNNHEETDKYFIDNPFNPGQIMYKSGDLAKKLEDGNLLFLKRKDKQVMIGGKRVEPLEVESVIEAHPNVNQSIIKVISDEINQNYLVAYIHSETALNKTDIESYLKQYLPSYMLPSFYVKIPQIPLTLNGKVDRNALPLILV